MIEVAHQWHDPGRGRPRRKVTDALIGDLPAAPSGRESGGHRPPPRRLSQQRHVAETVMVEIAHQRLRRRARRSWANAAVARAGSARLRAAARSVAADGEAGLTRAGPIGRDGLDSAGTDRHKHRGVFALVGDLVLGLEVDVGREKADIRRKRIGHRFDHLVRQIHRHRPAVWMGRDDRIHGWSAEDRALQAVIVPGVDGAGTPAKITLKEVGLLGRGRQDNVVDDVAQAEQRRSVLELALDERRDRARIGAREDGEGIVESHLWIRHGQATGRRQEAAREAATRHTVLRERAPVGGVADDRLRLGVDHRGGHRWIVSVPETVPVNVHEDWIGDGLVDRQRARRTTDRFIVRPAVT